MRSGRQGRPQGPPGPAQEDVRQDVVRHHPSLLGHPDLRAPGGARARLDARRFGVQDGRDGILGVAAGVRTSSTTRSPWPAAWGSCTSSGRTRSFASITPTSAGSPISTAPAGRARRTTPTATATTSTSRSRGTGRRPARPTGRGPPSRSRTATSPAESPASASPAAKGLEFVPLPDTPVLDTSTGLGRDFRRPVPPCSERLLGRGPSPRRPSRRRRRCSRRRAGRRPPGARGQPERQGIAAGRAHGCAVLGLRRTDPHRRRERAGLVTVPVGAVAR